MRKIFVVALAAGACACCGLTSAQAADISVSPQVEAPAPYYGQPPVAENYAYPPPPPVAYDYPPPPPPDYYVGPAYAAWPGPYYYGPYWRGYGPRFVNGYGHWGGHWGRGWRR
jgi:hypothetical protein